MRTRDTATALALVAALAACNAEPSQGSRVEDGAERAAPTAGESPASAGPAGEVAAGTREPSARPKAQVPEGVGAAWAPYYEHIDFVFGSEAGLARAAETARPMMMFYAATW